MSDRVALVLWSATLALAATGGLLILVSLDAQIPDNWGFRGYSDLTAPTFATAGLLIARRQPANVIGWLLLISGLATGFGGFVQEYATRALIIAPGSLPGAVALAWIASWSFAFAVGPVLTLIPQLFPTGRPLSPRWVPLLWCGATFVPIALFIFGLKPGPTENATFIENPVAVSGALADARAALEAPLSGFMVCTVAASGAALAMRFRRAHGVERQQLKWVASSAVLCALAFSGMIISGQLKLAQIFMVVALTTLPVAIGIAITRYRLYDIDLLINRTIVYGAVVAAGVATYFAAVVAIQALLRPFTSGNDLGVAGSTLLVIALFQPLRRRVQEAVDRRFYRSRYDAARTLDAFGMRLRSEVDLDSVRADLLDSVAEALQPAHASLWLRGRAR